MRKKSIKSVSFIVLTTLLLTMSYCFAEKVVLVYKTTLHADVHKENSSDTNWRYFVDTYKYYNIIEFDAKKRTYGKEYVIHYYGKTNKTQQQVEGMTYQELEKYDSEGKAYVKGTRFSTSDNPNLGDVRMKYGLVNLKSKINIGWSGGKVAVALKLRDKIVNREATSWKKYSSKSFSCKLDKAKTKAANEAGRTAKETFDDISQMLFEQGYKPKLTLDK